MTDAYKLLSLYPSTISLPISAPLDWWFCFVKKANSLLDESLSISSELGMRPLMERVLSRREILRA